MARAAKEPRESVRSFLTASGRMLETSERDILKNLKKLRAEWQSTIWDYYDEVPELKFGVNYQANAASKVRLFAAERGEGGEPIETTDATAVDLVERLKGGSASGHSSMLRHLTINLTLPGDCFLVGLMATEDEAESWDIYAMEEITKDASSNALKVKRDGKKDRVLIDKKDFISRIWWPHARNKEKADSYGHGVMSVCREILMLERAIRASLKSRIAGAGILLVPDELSDDPVNPNEDDSAEEAPKDKFTEDLLKAMSTPIENEDSASAVVPMIVKGPSKHLEQLRHLTIDRPLDPLLDARMKQAQLRLAQGLNVSVESVLGKGGLNHWTSFQISDSDFKDHLEPTLVAEVDALTQAYFVPMLRAASVANPERFFIWYDPAALVVRPNRGDDAKDLYDRIEISGAALRDATDFPETAAPDDAERAHRERLKAGPRGEVTPAEEDPDANDDPPAADQDTDNDEAATTASSARPSRELPELGRRLGAIDNNLKSRLHVAADGAMRHALSRAGARLRSKANRNSQLRTAIANVTNVDVARNLSRSVVASLGLEETELIEGAFDDVAGQFLSWASAAQNQALMLVPDLSSRDRNAAAVRQADDLEGAMDWFRSSLTELAHDRLYDPSPEPPDVGEYDGTVVVPFGVVREAVARAGGAAGPSASVTAGLLERLATAQLGVFGIATGWLLRELFETKDVLVDGYQWDYGVFPRSRPFEAHQLLDGLEFSNFDDEALRNYDPFPPVEFFLPGDHDGCVCNVNPKMIERGS